MLLSRLFGCCEGLVAYSPPFILKERCSCFVHCDLRVRVAFFLGGIFWTGYRFRSFGIDRWCIDSDCRLLAG